MPLPAQTPVGGALDAPDKREYSCRSLADTNSQLIFILAHSLLLLQTVAALISYPPAGPLPGWLEREAFLMGTTLRIVAELPDSASGAPTLEPAFDAVRRLEASLSTWREDSDLALLNRSPVGHPRAIPPAVYHLLGEVRRWTERTGGAFDPAVGALVDAWDLRGTGRHPSPEALERARRASGLTRFAWDDPTATVARREAEAWLDSGGFGKGAALRLVRDALRAAGIPRAFADFGGQWLAIGGRSDENPWPVAVAHPARRDKAVAWVGLRDASIATSGQSERSVRVGDTRLGHILDPRTGRPVSAWGSVTVLAQDPLAADVLATALFVLGPAEGLRWAEANDVAALFLVARDGRLERRASRLMRGHLLDDPTSGKE